MTIVEHKVDPWQVLKNFFKIPHQLWIDAMGMAKVCALPSTLKQMYQFILTLQGLDFSTVIHPNE